jgi:hypothetical protein
MWAATGLVLFIVQVADVDVRSIKTPSARRACDGHGNNGPKAAVTVLPYRLCECDSKANLVWFFGGGIKISTRFIFNESAP